MRRMTVPQSVVRPTISMSADRLLPDGASPPPYDHQNPGPGPNGNGPMIRRLEVCSHCGYETDHAVWLLLGAPDRDPDEIPKKGRQPYRFTRCLACGYECSERISFPFAQTTATPVSDDDSDPGPE